MKTVHAMADCRDCDWHCGDYRTAVKAGKAHSKSKGHTVSVEVGTAARYVNGREEQ